MVRGQESKVICCGYIRGPAFPVEAIFQNDAQSICGFHHDVNDTIIQVAKSRFAAGLATNVKENGTSGFVVRSIIEVALGKRCIGVWLVACFSVEVVNLCKRQQETVDSRLRDEKQPRVSQENPFL